VGGRVSGAFVVVAHGGRETRGETPVQY
jgi:hypothetical protein